MVQRLCSQVAHHQTRVENGITISIGVTALNIDDNADSVVIRADNALYRAKELGRNRVIGNFQSIFSH